MQTPIQKRKTKKVCRDFMLRVRLRRTEIDAYEWVAAQQGVSVSQWIRQLANEEATREIRKAKS